MSDPRGPDDLDAWAAAAVERGRAAWPGLAVSHDEIAHVVTDRLANGSVNGEPARLGALDAAELYVAIACARGDPAALAQFRARYFEPLVPS
ncbi:MAG TPA: hypothetical protein VGD80_25225, partial [Kofleriaceae bacterium]